MKRFRVHWEDDALDALAYFWMQNPQQHAAINQAQLEIDRRLGSDPTNNVIHVREDLYKIEVRPFWAYFEVIHVQSRVNVQTLAWIG